MSKREITSKDLKDPYNRIMNAAEAGRGVRLTADEVWKMHLDGAIADHATHLVEKANGREH